MQDDICKNGRKTGLTIKKLDLMRSVHQNVGLSKTDSGKMIDQIVSLITESLASGQDVKLSNFGTFKLVNKADRLGRNPKTNAKVLIPSRRVVQFKASSKLSQRIIKANLNEEKPSSGRLTEQKRNVLSALGNKIGSEICDLDFIFNSTSAKQVQKDVEIPDVRNFSHEKTY